MYLRNALFWLFLCFSSRCFVSVFAWVCLPDKAVLLSCSNRLTGTSNTPTVKPLTISAQPRPCHPCSLDQLPECLSLAHLCLQLHQNCLTVTLMSPPLETSDSHLHITTCSENLPLGLTTPQVRFAFSSALCDHNNTVLLKTPIIKVQNSFTVLHDLFLFQDYTKNLNRRSHYNHDWSGTDVFSVLKVYQMRWPPFSKLSKPG